MAIDSAPTATSSQPDHDPPIGLARIAGLIAAAVSLAASELFAGLFSGLPSLVTGVATFVIDNVPTPIKDLAIDVFGTADKTALGVGIVLVSMLIGLWIGARSIRERRTAAIVFGLFGLLGALAAARTAEGELGPALVNGALAAGAGLFTLRTLVGLLGPGAHTDVGRRSFIVGASSATVFGILAALVGVNLATSTREALEQRVGISLPSPSEPIPSPVAATSLEVDGISPLVTPNESFYRIDTAFIPPNVDVSTWSMRVTGMVDRQVELNYEDLLEMDLVERYITIACVSNEVGGELIGNAKWLGVPLSEVLNQAGVWPGAEQLVGRSVDQFTVGFPVEAAFDGREALIAIGMNGEPLATEHGFPARLVVAGLYGYVSATKWLEEIHLTTWDAFDPYWIPRGWSREAPIKTQARIDTPRGRVGENSRAIAGVAWAPHRGISRVEVRIDEGSWQEAELAEPLNNDTWRQWALPWDPTPGRHVLQVRATDGDGNTQTADEAPPAPDGATGYHTVTVEA